MEWLNYHHLLYFWVVAREGGLVRAGKVLRLSHPTLSTQIHALEDRLGEKLFTKVGRRLVLTDAGQVVFRYAGEIFTLGRELMTVIQGRPTGRPIRLSVGIADVVPKTVVRRILRAALELPEPVHLVCREDSCEQLLADLALHTLDVVIADGPVPAGSSIRGYSHQLGETGISFFGTKALAKAYRRRFPRSLDGAPVLLPLPTLALRRSLDDWFERNGIRPRVVAEFEDSALLEEFGRDGVGVFPAPTVVAEEVAARHGVEVVGAIDEVRARFFAISAERRLENPAVVAISEAARQDLFATGRERRPRAAR